MRTLLIFAFVWALAAVAGAQDAFFGPWSGSGIESRIEWSQRQFVRPGWGGGDWGGGWNGGGFERPEFAGSRWGGGGFGGGGWAGTFAPQITVAPQITLGRFRDRPPFPFGWLGGRRTVEFSAGCPFGICGR